MQYAVRMTVHSSFTCDNGKVQHHAAETIIPCFGRTDAMGMASVLAMDTVSKSSQHGQDKHRAYDVVVIMHTSKGRVVLSLGDLEMLVEDYNLSSNA